MKYNQPKNDYFKLSCIYFLNNLIKFYVFSVVSQQFCNICRRENPSKYKTKKKGGCTEWVNFKALSNLV